MDEKLLTISEASEYLGVSKDTLRRWEKKKIIKPYRSPTKRRYYDKKQLDYVFVRKPDVKKDSPGNKPEQKEIPPKKVAKSVSKKLRTRLFYILVFLVFLNLTLIAFYIYQYFSF